MPYSFDPEVVMSGEVDAASEFCPDTPFIIRQLGGSSFLALATFLLVVLVEQLVTPWNRTGTTVGE